MAPNIKFCQDIHHLAKAFLPLEPDYNITLLYTFLTHFDPDEYAYLFRGPRLTSGTDLFHIRLLSTLESESVARACGPLICFHAPLRRMTQA